MNTNSYFFYFQTNGVSYNHGITCNNVIFQRPYIQKKINFSTVWIFAIQNPLQLSLIIPDAQLSAFYKAEKAEKIGCRKSIVNYNLGGSKSTSVLLDVAASGGAFQRNPCPAPSGKQRN